MLDNMNFHLSCQSGLPLFWSGGVYPLDQETCSKQSEFHLWIEIVIAVARSHSMVDTLKEEHMASFFSLQSAILSDDGHPLDQEKTSSSGSGKSACPCRVLPSIVPGSSCLCLVQV